MVRDPMNTPVHAVRHMGCHRHTQGASSPTAGGVRDPEEIGPCRSLRWREVHQFPFPRTSSPAATVDHSKTMRVLMLQEELVQQDPERCRLLKRDSQMQYPPTGPPTIHDAPVTSPSPGSRIEVHAAEGPRRVDRAVSSPLSIISAEMSSVVAVVTDRATRGACSAGSL